MADDHVDRPEVYAWQHVQPTGTNRSRALVDNDDRARCGVLPGREPALRRLPPYTNNRFSVAIAAGSHPFPFRTRKLSLPAPMVLGDRSPGRVGRRRIPQKEALRGLLRVFGSGRDGMRAGDGSSGRLARPCLPPNALHRRAGPAARAGRRRDRAGARAAPRGARAAEGGPGRPAQGGPGRPAGGQGRRRRHAPRWTEAPRFGPSRGPQASAGREAPGGAGTSGRRRLEAPRRRGRRSSTRRSGLVPSGAGRPGWRSSVGQWPSRRRPTQLGAPRWWAARRHRAPQRAAG